MNLHKYQSWLEAGAQSYLRRKKWIDDNKRKITYHSDRLMSGFPDIPCDNSDCELKMNLKAVVDFEFDSIVVEFMCMNAHKISVKVKV